MTIRFLVDEDLTRSTAGMLRDEGYDAHDVRDVGLGGHSDLEVFQHAQSLNAVVLTADSDFANILRFPPGSHVGLVVSRIPGRTAPPTWTATLCRLTEWSLETTLFTQEDRP